MLKDSKLYSFLDNENSFTFHFLEGAQMIQNMAILHHLQGNGFAYYRDLLLAISPMVSLLKKGESFGFYLDSEKPYFRFKLETNFLGNFRTLMLPEDFNQFPQKISGTVRLSKLFENSQPYTSISMIEDKNFEEIVNQILKDSYQIDSRIIISDIADQSLLISKIPRENVGRYLIDPGLKVDDYIKKYHAELTSIFAENYQDEEKIKTFFNQKNWYFLGERTFHYHCPCSKERIIKSLVTLNREELESCQNERGLIEINCDYCHKHYEILIDEI